MKLITTTGMLGDATYWLKATDIPDNLTIEDAIKWIVSLNKNEFGSIYVGKHNIEIATYYHCEITSGDTDMIAQLQGKVVENIDAKGGWGQMNYYITLK